MEQDNIEGYELHLYIQERSFHKFQYLGTIRIQPLHICRIQNRLNKLEEVEVEE